MILLFLGSWRSTLIVLVSIPLSILTSLAVLAALGETVNIMTLGGLALAVGILVDDATVAIENTYRLLEEGHEFRHSVVHGAAGIAKPALISTLSICCAFVSVTFLTDAPKYLFTPQALAVVFGMLASYVLSRTLVPILIDVLVKNETARPRPGRQADQRVRPYPRRLRAGFHQIPPRLCRPAARGHPPPPGHAGCRRFDRGVRRRPVHVRRHRLLPADRRRADDAACARALRHAHRAGGKTVPAGRGHDPPGGAAQRNRHDHRQYRPAGIEL